MSDDGEYDLAKEERDNNCLRYKTDRIENED